MAKNSEYTTKDVDAQKTCQLREKHHLRYSQHNFSGQEHHYMSKLCEDAVI